MGKVMRHTLGASLNIRHNLSSSKGPKPLQLKLLTTYIPKTSAFTSDFQGVGSLLTDPQITYNQCVSISKLKFITLIYSTEILGQIYLETATWRALSSTSARIIPAIVSAGSLV